MPELGTSGSVGTAGEQSPAVTRPVEAARYQTRDQEQLATGFKMDGALGYVLYEAAPRWDLSLRSVLQENDLVNRLPSTLSRAKSGPVDIEDVLPAEYRFLGLGTSVQGSTAASTHGALQYSLDAYTGWQWPAAEPSYGVQMSIVTPALSWRDHLTFTLAYASALSGGSDDAYSKASLVYGYRF